MMTVAGTLVAAVVAINVTAAPASRKPNNRQATKEFVSDYVMRSHELHRLSIEGRQTLRRFVSETIRGCRGVLVGSPHGTAGAEPIEVEISEALDLTITRIGAPAIARFGYRLGRIRWRRSALNVRAQTVTKASSSFTNALPVVPKLCSDLIAWKNGNYREPLPSTVKFDHDMTTPPVVPKKSMEAEESDLAHLLRQYENWKDQSILSDARQLIKQTAIENFTALAREKTVLTNALYARV